MQKTKSPCTALVTAAAVAIGCLVAPPAQAVSVINGSFETAPDPGPFTTLGTGDTSITGWLVSSGDIDYIGSYWQASDGSRSLDMNGFQPGSITQVITGLSIGQQYKISFDLAGNPDAGPDTKTLFVLAGVSANFFDFNIAARDHDHMGWVTKSFLFTATGPEELLIFASTVLSGGTDENKQAFGPALDNVSIAATPLPAALPLFAGGLGVIGLLARRRKRKAAGLIAPLM